MKERTRNYLAVAAMAAIAYPAFHYVKESMEEIQVQPMRQTVEIGEIRDGKIHLYSDIMSEEAKNYYFYGDEHYAKKQ